MNLTSTFKKALFVKFVALKIQRIANFNVEISYFVPLNKIFSSFLKNKCRNVKLGYNVTISFWIYLTATKFTKTAFKKDPQAQTLSELQLK